VDHAREKLTAKRGGGEQNLTLDEKTSLLPEFNATPEQIVIRLAWPGLQMASGRFRRGGQRLAGRSC
jgi:hypothetical protein